MSSTSQTSHDDIDHDVHQPLSSWQAFVWLWHSYLSQYKGILCGALALMVIEGSMLGGISWLLQPMFDDAFSQGKADGLLWTGFAIFCVFLIRAASSMGHNVLLTNASQSASAALRGDLLQHLMSLESAYHQKTAPGQTIERVQSDVFAMCGAWITVFVGVGRDLVAVIVLFGVAISVDPLWTLIALVGAPLLVVPALIAQRYVRTRSGAARDIAARMSTRLDEVLHGVNSVKLNTLESYQLQRYTDLSMQRVRAEVKAAAGHAAVPAMTDIMTGLGFFAVIVFGGAEILSGEKTIGQFMSFFTAMSLTFGPLRKLGSLGGQWEIAVASIERVQDILKCTPAILSPACPVQAPSQVGDLRFEDVSLRYNGVPALHEVSFTAPAGKTTAFVGSSGAGKSTIFNALTRLVDPNSGQILMGQTLIHDLKLQDLRRLFSTVSQDTTLFDESLRDNILFGRADVTQEKLDEILRASHVDGFVSQLPQGLDSPSGPRGSNLSGGQRQRIAIARALLRDTPILLLDEATSALDTKSETLVKNALETLSQGRTTLVIAHRLSTIRSADQIIVMDQGRIVGQGTHEALLSAGGLYAELHRLQFGRTENVGT